MVFSMELLRSRSSAAMVFKSTDTMRFNTFRSSSRPYRTPGILPWSLSCRLLRDPLCPVPRSVAANSGNDIVAVADDGDDDDDDGAADSWLTAAAGAVAAAAMTALLLLLLLLLLLDATWRTRLIAARKPPVRKGAENTGNIILLNFVGASRCLLVVGAFSPRYSDGFG